MTNEDLEIVGQTSAYIKLEKFKTPIRMEFLVCLDEGDEALLCLDTLKELSIVPWNFPTPMDKHRREPKAPKARRVRDYEEEDEWLTQKERERMKRKKGRDRKRGKWKKGSCSLYKKEWAASGHIRI